MNLTSENLFLLAVGALAVWLLHKFSQPRSVPAANAPPTVTARVVESNPPPVTTDTIQLFGQLHQAIEAKGTVLAFERQVNQMVEAKAASVTIPWVAPTAPTEPPKA